MPQTNDAIQPDEPTDEERLEQLENDFETPARPEEDAMNADANTPERRHTGVDLDDTHPVTDTNLQPEEIYDEGTSGAAEASEPNDGDAVEGYDPDKDQRRNKDHEDV